MPDAYLAQAAAVQNTWYTVLEASNVMIHYICVVMATADETLEVEVTLDGVEMVATIIATAATPYYFTKITNPVWGPGGDLAAGSTSVLQISGDAATSPLPARNAKIRVRKTTAGGANTLYCLASYDKW